MNLVIRIQGFDFTLPVAKDEPVVVVDIHGLLDEIDAHRLHARTIFADVLDES